MQSYEADKASAAPVPLPAEPRSQPEPNKGPGPRKWGRLVFWGKVLVTLLTLGFLYNSIFAAPDTAAAWRTLLATSLSGAGRTPVLLALALVPVNWGLEAWKWYRLARHLEPVTFGRSLRAVLVGLTLGFATPNRVGDYAGRIIELKSRRVSALGAVFLGRYCQLVATVLAGVAGLLYFLLTFYFNGYPAAGVGISVSALLICLAVLVPLYRSRLLLAALGLWRPLRRFRPALAIMPTYPAQALHAVLAISGLRYAVFCAQFLLLLHAYGAASPFGPGLAAVAGTFLMKSLVPSLNALADVGVRELSATHLFGLLGQPALPVLSASLSLWVINIALPSATGLLLVPGLRVLRSTRPGR
ncbi:flippase-like domain-containing protein [Hymenobacter sp. BT683]|uniref:Flippase-like domain-containing protein n=1 Tax=Hymenobacter jeongseonensis TaxID=2791027 RepID=A0ABS0IFP0_9BACT|nr:lysylphosphatidylglycerol synthase transmembrane domain-containing protein [Hymenobacter jeongseonensis]MBF9237182.1 flippase-like domain-containing protein [Hymenobacter jeongseonensis]